MSYLIFYQLMWNPILFIFSVVFLNTVLEFKILFFRNICVTIIYSTIMKLILFLFSSKLYVYYVLHNVEWDCTLFQLFFCFVAPHSTLNRILTIVVMLENATLHLRAQNISTYIVQQVHTLKTYASTHSCLCMPIAMSRSHKREMAK